MSTVLKLENFSPNNLIEKTALSEDVEAGSDSIKVENTDVYEEGDLLLVGRPAEERSEIRKADSVEAPDTIGLDAELSRPHYSGEEVTSLVGDQIKVYRAPNVDGLVPDDSQFLAVGAPVDIQADDQNTLFVDDSGGSDYWYKYTYRNSETTSESPLSGSEAARGEDFNNYASVDDIRREAGFMGNENIPDSLINEKRLAAQDEINGALAAYYTVPFETAPPLIRELTIQMAAAMLLQTEYGPMSDGVSKEGFSKLKQARETLSRIQNREIVLNDAAGNSLIGTTGVHGWPDDTTKDASEDEAGGGRMFRSKQRF